MSLLIYNSLYITYYTVNILVISLLGFLFGSILCGIIIINLLKLHHVEFDPSFILFINAINLIFVLSFIYYLEKLYIFYML
jgi:hypothetical protein